MEAQSMQKSQVAETLAPLNANVKICGGHGCSLSNCGSDSNKDAKLRSASMRKLFMAVLICMIFICIEVVGGIKANSFSLLTDAAHLLSDLASFFISIFSIWASTWEATPRHSYGFYRIEIIGALGSIQLIWLITGIILYEAIQRMIHGTTRVHGKLMFIIAGIGLLVNIIMVVLLGHHHGHNHGGGHVHGDHGHNHEHDHSHEQVHGHDHDSAHHHHHNESLSIEIDISTLSVNDDRRKLRRNNKTEAFISQLKKNKRNINVHSAYLHALGDSLQSIGVMIGGAIIWYKPEWMVVDLLCTLIFSVIVITTTINLLKKILAVLMESSPTEIDVAKLEKGVCEVEGVVAVHELHLWSITIGQVLLACHVTIIPDADFDVILDHVIEYIRKEYNINHVTIQIEREKAPN